MTNLCRTAGALILGMLLARASIAEPAVEEPVFPTGVERVKVDVVVLDRDGMPVPGLSREDFLIKEDGEPQAIVDFEAITVPAAQSMVESSTRPRVSSNAGEGARHLRTFIIVFDGLHLSPAGAEEAKKALRAFLKESVREGDRVAFVATQSRTWWTARILEGRTAILGLLERQQGVRQAPSFFDDWMSDYEAMRIAVYEDVHAAAKVWRRWKKAGIVPLTETEPTPVDISPMVMSRARDVHARATARVNETLEVIRRVLDPLGDDEDRKALILLSEGFVHELSLPSYERVIDAARRASTAIYFMDAGGLRGSLDVFSARFGPSVFEQDLGAYLFEPSLSSQGAEVVAAESGGFSIRNTNAMADGLARVALESTNYYLIGYEPTNTRHDGTYRKITVDVSRRDVTVRARRGYWAPRKTASATERAARLSGDADKAIQTTLDSPYDRDDIPLRMTALVRESSAPGKAKVVVLVDVDVRDFQFREEDGLFFDGLQVFLVVAHAETEEHAIRDETIEMRLSPETRARLVERGHTIAREFELAPGRYQARLVARDTNSGRLGSLTHHFAVPELGQLRVSSLLLTDMLGQTESGAPAPVPIARRTFDRGSTLVFQYEVYGARPHPDTEVPRVSAGYELVSSDGTVARQGRPTVINSNNGHVMRSTRLSLDGLPAGDYQILLRIRDEVARQTVEAREPFTILDRRDDTVTTP